MQARIQYTLPSENYGDHWIEVINTMRNEITPEGMIYNPGDVVTAEGRSVILLQNPHK